VCVCVCVRYYSYQNFQKKILLIIFWHIIPDLSNSILFFLIPYWFLSHNFQVYSRERPSCPLESMIHMPESVRPNLDMDFTIIVHGEYGCAIAELA